MTLGEYRNLPIAPETLPEHLRGFARAINERHDFIPPVPPPDYEAKHYNPNKVAIEAYGRATGKLFLPPDQRATGARRVSLARALTDHYLLTDLGLNADDAIELLSLACDDASTAAIYIEELAYRVGRYLIIDARGYHSSSACTRTELERKLRDQHGHVHPLIDVVVYDDDVYMEVPLEQGSEVERPFLKHRFWQLNDMDLVHQLARHASWEQYLELSCYADRLGVSTATVRMPRLSDFDIENSDEVPTRQKSGEEQSYNDYILAPFRTPISRIGYVVPIDFRDSGHGNLRASEPVGLDTPGMLTPSKRTMLLMTNVMSKIYRNGIPIGHRSIISGRHAAPAHLFNDSNIGLFSYASKAFGLLSTEPRKSATYSVYVLTENGVRCAEVRVIRVNNTLRSFYFECKSDLIAGCSGAIIADERLRAVGIVDRVVSRFAGSYEALFPPQDVSGFLLDVTDPKKTTPELNSGRIAPVYNYLDADDEFVFVGYNATLPQLTHLFELQPEGLVRYSYTPSGSYLTPDAIARGTRHQGALAREETCATREYQRTALDALDLINMTETRAKPRMNLMRIEREVSTGCMTAEEAIRLRRNSRIKPHRSDAGVHVKKSGPTRSNEQGVLRRLALATLAMSTVCLPTLASAMVAPRHDVPESVTPTLTSAAAHIPASQLVYPNPGVITPIDTCEVRGFTEHSCIISLQCRNPCAGACGAIGCARSDYRCTPYDPDKERPPAPARETTTTELHRCLCTCAPLRR